MGRDRLVQIVSAAVLLLSLGVSGVLATRVSAEAGRAQLVYTDVAADGDPPAVAAGIAMGAFRGLFVNYLWLRATRLKEEGKFYEAIELSSAITKLQPRFPRVWAFHAWNMAYNISVATKTADERWQWVRAGIRLLRDEAIPMNPNDVLLHKELAWIFIHKVQGYTDDANRYYKRRMAEEWTYVLGEPPRLPEDTEAATEMMLDFFRPVAEAPASLETLIEREIAERTAGAPPGDPAPESDVRRLVDRLLAEAGLEPGLDLLRLVAWHEATRGAWLLEEGLINVAETNTNPELSALLEDESLADAWDRLLPFVRKRVVVDDFNMEPRLMLAYMEEFGPLDWRHPASHALYWAARGVEEAMQRRSTVSSDTINTDRILFHAIQELWRSGTIYYDLLADEHVTLQNFHFTDTYDNIMQALVDRAGIVEDEGRVFRLYSAGYENFQKEVVRAYYRLGERQKAWEYFLKYISWDGRNLNDPRQWEDQSRLALDQWVKAQLKEDRLLIPYVYASEVTAALTGAFLRGLLGGDRRLFESQYRWAKDLHEYYHSEVLRTSVDAETNRMEELPADFLEVVGVVLYRLISTGGVQTAQASTVFRAAPVEVQRVIYDDVARLMASRGMRPEAFGELFPEPPEMEAFRALRELQDEMSDEARQRQLEMQRQ